MNPGKIFIADARQYITSAIKRDKVSIWYPLILLKSFHNVSQVSIIVFSNMEYGISALEIRDNCYIAINLLIIYQS